MSELREKVSGIILHYLDACAQDEFAAEKAVNEIHEAYRSEIERAGEVGIDPHNYTNPTAIKIGIAMQQAHILKRLEAQSFETGEGGERT